MKKANKKLSLVLLILMGLALMGVTVSGIVALNSNKSPLSNSNTVSKVKTADGDSYIDVTALGAVPDDNKEDTDAFLKAAETGADIYVPEGTYEVKDTISLKGQSLRGAGAERSIIKCTNKKMFAKLSGAVIVEDITLGFSEACLKEKDCDCIALFDNGITNGSVIRSVKLTDVGTGFYSDKELSPSLELTLEAVQIDRYLNRAIYIENASATLLRSVSVKECLDSTNSAVTLGGSFTVESIAFCGNSSNYQLELVNTNTATVKNIVFEGCEPKSGKLIKSVSSAFSVQMLSATNSIISSIFDVKDAVNEALTYGEINLIYSDINNISVDESNRIRYEKKIFGN